MACAWTKQQRVLQLPNIFLHFGKHRHCLPCFSAFLLKPCSFVNFPLCFMNRELFFRRELTGIPSLPVQFPYLCLSSGHAVKSPIAGCTGCECWQAEAGLCTCLSSNPLLPLLWNGNFTELTEPSVSHGHAAAPSTERNSCTSQTIVHGT